MLREQGKHLNQGAYTEVAEYLAAFPDREPWHVSYALALAWGRFSRLEETYVEAVVNLLEDWNDEDLATAREFHYEKGPVAIEESLRGGRHLFERTAMAGTLPSSFAGLKRSQDRWLRYVVADKPGYIGGWNATAVFMVALFAQPDLAATLTEPEVLLPIGGPILNGLRLMADAGLTGQAPVGAEAEEAGPDLGHIAINNGLFAEIRQGLPDWSLLDVHSGLYLLGTRLPESKNWAL
ncbi:MAG: hypothetical protein GC145_07840 [Caulobacter sp.]|nr:hypothetical protein [Caulobacter sp.]